MEINSLIFSDVHGDRDAMKRIREACRYFSSERMFSLGDLCPDPYDPVFRSIEGVRGNSDRYHEYGLLPFPPLFLTLELYSKRVLMMHGHLEAEKDEDVDVILSGHTHVAELRKAGKLYLANPGSASLPRSSLPPSALLFSPSGLTLFSLLDFRKISSLSFSES